MQLCFSKYDFESKTPIYIILGFPNECKYRYIIYGGNRMVFSSEHFLSFMQSTRRTVQNFSTRKSRPLKIKQGIPFVEFKTRCENSKALFVYK